MNSASVSQVAQNDSPLANKAGHFRRRRRTASRNAAFRLAVTATAALLPLSLIAVVVFLAIEAWPALHFNGWRFLFSNDWNLGSQYGTPVMEHGRMVLPGAHYGILFLIVGTLASSLLAMVLAIPVGIGAAVFIAEVIPGKIREFAASFVELLAAVPSVVFGLWGIVVLIPFLSHHVFPVIAHHVGFIPFLAGPTYSGYGLFASALVLMLMVVPLITANLREAITATPAELREAGAAIGATHFEVTRHVILPRLRRAIVGVSILALGRALGETMAVLMVSGNALGYLPGNIYTPISTMAAFIVSQLDSALQDPTGMAVYSLAEIGLILLVLSIISNSIARLPVFTGKAH